MTTSHRTPRRRLTAAVVAVLVVGASAAGLGAISLASAAPADTQQPYAREGQTCTTTAAGYCTINHGLGTMPEYVGISNSGVVLWGVDAKTSATFRVRFAKNISNSGVVTPYANTPVRFDWSAVFTPPDPVPTTPPPTTTDPPTTTPAPTTTAPTTTAPATTTPAPTTTAPAAGWPDGTNTGVPAGTTLTAYTGPCTITAAGTVIDAKDTTAACSMLFIHAANVTIRRSKTHVINATDGGSVGWSVNISDSTVSAPGWSEGAVWGYNITAARLNITGGQHSFHCNDNCTLTDSWLHDQYNPAGGAYHNNAFITNGGHDMVVRHNTLHCTPLLNSTNGGCTADVSLFGDFDPVIRVTIENNLLKANNSSISYCAYGGYQPAKQYPVSTYIVFKDNVWERGANGKCGVYGPVTSFQTTATGNQWVNNKWEDGAVVNP